MVLVVLLGYWLQEKDGNNTYDPPASCSSADFGGQGC